MGLTASAGASAKTAGAGRMQHGFLLDNLRFRDRFTGANNSLSTHVPDVNRINWVGPWTSTGPDIGSNQLGSGAIGAIRAVSSFTNGFLRATFFGSSATNGATIIFRGTSAATGTDEWRAGYNVTNTIISIIERVASTNTTRASTSGTSHGTVATYVIEVTLNGASVTVNNPTQGVSATYGSATTGLTSGVIGLQTGNSASTVDDFEGYFTHP